MFMYVHQKIYPFNTFLVVNYRIYLIKRPGRFFNFWTFRVGAYSRWALIRGWVLIKFSHMLVRAKL